jgi:heme ABC exporter ATP-binding subunit CcmA
VLEAAGIGKRFRGVDVLKGVDLQISAGETVILYGPNGAGKTTLLRIFATLARPHAGSFRIAGVADEDREDIRAHLYYSGHGNQLYEDLVPEENLRFFCGLYGIKPSPADFRRVLEHVGMWRFRDFQVGTFSAGMKRRVGLARIMLLKPALLLLDEPYTSLDKAGIKLVNDYLKEFAQNGGATLMASHSPELVAELPHRAVWLAGGKLSSEAPGHVA